MGEYESNTNANAPRNLVVQETQHTIPPFTKRFIFSINLHNQLLKTLLPLNFTDQRADMLS